MKKFALTVCMVLLVCNVAYAGVNVNYNDIYTFKKNFSKGILEDYNGTGVSDNVVYGYIISSINSAWDTYSTFPLFLYHYSNGEVHYGTIPTHDELFDDDAVKIIEVQSKAIFLRAIYKTLKDLDLSQVYEPEWIMVAIQDENDEVIYLLEVNIGNIDSEIVEEHTIKLLDTLGYSDSSFGKAAGRSTYRLIIASYVRKIDEVIVNVLYTDGDGNVYCEGILTRDRIFGRYLALQ